ncbi:MAG: bifunctional 23S rRNA (guanine(2069)-N(7))-methyltransferase RlmK/23S rRNA (guanine(2445)-N(2))-methyltransferase RlmL [Gammaproteobacteria bacterium]
MNDFQFFASAPRNLEALLAEELRGLGIGSAAEGRGGVSFHGGLADAYRACLWSRVANRVLLPLARFPAPTPEALYEGVRRIPWQDHFGVDRTFAIDVTAAQAEITHSHYAALKTKDAVADQFRERTGARPSVQTGRPDLQINVYLRRDEAVVSIDLSGESLHRRGYRTAGAAAPLKENLAAGILLRAGWPGIARAGGAFLDPLCGSGTLPIEAALIAADIAPGLRREYWGFHGWQRHDAGLWQGLIAEAEERRSIGLAQLPVIRGCDHDARAVRDALANAARAGLEGRVHLETRALADCTPARAGGTGLLATNPPYGQRVGAAADLPALYDLLGRVMKERFQGWRAAVLTDDPELCRHFGLRVRRMHTLYNGAIECRLMNYELTPEWFHAERPESEPGPRPLPAPERGEGARMFANRLVKNRRHLRSWLAREDIHAYRLYDADLPEYALAVDVYEGERLWAHVQEYRAPATVDEHKARQRLREALGVILEVLEIPEGQLFFKVRQRQKGAAQYEKLAEKRIFHEVREGGLRFLVNFEDYLDTGLFLDHRPTRALIRKLAPGTRFLNLFAYTGTASVYAAAGGAASTVTVDMSNTYLEWARSNMSLNGFTGRQHEFVQADCLDWLAQTGQRRFDLIFLDPPSFSTSKRMSGTLDVQRDHVDLIGTTAGLLAAGGTLIFSSNLRRFRLDQGALADLGLAAEDISHATLPKDFARDARIHRCWRIARKA